MTDSDTTKNSMAADVQLFPWWLFLIWGLLTLIIGLSFLITPIVTMELFVTFLGAYWLVGGLFMIGGLVVDRTNVGMKILLAVINIIAGTLILAYPLYSTVFVFAFFVLFLGFWAVFIGAVHLFHGFTRKDPGNGVLGAISIVFGILLLTHTVVAVALLPLVAGGFCILSGLTTVYVAVMAKKVAEASAA